MQNNRNNFWSRNNYFWKVPISHIIQNHWKNQLYYELFSFNLTVKFIHLCNFRLWNCLWTRNAFRLVVPKVFLFQMLGKASIFTLPGKVPLWQKYQNDVLCGNMDMDVSPHISTFKFFFKNTCSTMTAWIHVSLLQIKIEMIYLSKQVCLIIIHRNTTHILDVLLS